MIVSREQMRKLSLRLPGQTQQSLDPNSELTMPPPELFLHREVLRSLNFSKPPPQGLGIFGSLSLSNHQGALKLAFISRQLWDTDTFNSDSRCFFFWGL